MRGPRLWRVRNYQTPEVGTPAFYREPFSGKKVRQAIIKERKTKYIQGRLLVNQCSYRNPKTNKRCKRTTRYDYTLCTHHLVKERNLMVAPSRIPGAGLGLYACDYAHLKKLGLDDQRRPIPDPQKIILEFGSYVGGDDCVFHGEVLDNFEDRYDDRNGGDYAIGGPKDSHVDELFARTVLSYSNDAIDVKDPQMRRNYYCTEGEFHNPNPDFPYYNNCIGVEQERTGETSLQALKPIYHGEEIMWSYAGDLLGASKDERGRWIKDPKDRNSPVDKYWSAINRMKSYFFDLI